VARALKEGQPAVAKLERRTDMYDSNLRRDTEALGGVGDHGAVRGSEGGDSEFRGAGGGAESAKTP